MTPVSHPSNVIPARVNAWPTLVSGLLLVALNGVVLLTGQVAGSRGTPLWGDAIVLNLTFLLWLPSSDRRKGMIVPQKDRLTVILPFFVVWTVVSFLVKTPWSVPLLGIAFAVVFIGIGRVVRRRPYYAVAIGWSLAGLTVDVFDVGIERLAIFFFAGGIVTTLQGLRDLICDGTSL